ncbi:MAG TPA: SARP family transcriptional regulator, partial [Actinomycetota bacterium]|nr:SARP family transcriptional regulator [Actinomycetota bacterium]
MALRVRLVGPPGLARDDGSPVLRGRTTWGLLAYLLLEPGPPTRRDLAVRLWPEADDPLAALRWTLLQVRRVLVPEAEIAERNHRLELLDDGSVSVDAVRILSGTWEPDDEGSPLSGELLEGFSFDDAPAFEG